MCIVSLSISKVTTSWDEHGCAFYRVELTDGANVFVLPEVSAKNLRSYGRFRTRCSYFLIEQAIRERRRPPGFFRYAPCEGKSRDEIKANWKAHVRQLIDAGRPDSTGPDHSGGDDQ